MTADRASATRPQRQSDDPQGVAEADPRELAREQVRRGDARDQRDQAAEPDPLEPDGGHLAAGDGGEQPLAQGGQDVPPAAQLGPGGAGQGHALQQRHHADQLVRTRLLQRQVSGPLRPDVERELGQELGHVQADLQVAGGHVAVARVEQHDLVVAGQQDAVGGQRPVRDPVLVQYAARRPRCSAVRRR